MAGTPCWLLLESQEQTLCLVTLRKLSQMWVFVGAAVFGSGLAQPGRERLDHWRKSSAWTAVARGLPRHSLPTPNIKQKARMSTRVGPAFSKLHCV